MKHLIAAILICLPLAAPAHGASPEQAATDMSEEIMSPFCPGVTLHECPSAEALELRDRIETWFRDGMTRDEILLRLEDEYGVGVRAAPAPEGAGLLAWLIAGLGVLAALGAAAFLIKRWTNRPPRSLEDTVTPGDRARLDEELARLRGAAP